MTCKATSEPINNNEAELIKIQEALSGWLKKSARRAVAKGLLAAKPLIDDAKALSGESRDAALQSLVEEATVARHLALNEGANSYGHAKWAKAAACETWLFELRDGSPASIARIEFRISQLCKG